MTVRSFEELVQDRADYIRIARKNGFEEGLRSLLSELYPDNAHFIYEILQNAEDAHATAVDFRLHDDRLVVTHDGVRAFSLDDIESITSIGQSTKRDDPTSIGKFGVGFKAVFAYTTRPEVRSGDFSFAIEDLFVPRLTHGDAVSGETRFTFPFDRPEKPSDMASAEVQRGLEDLDEKTLLFLNHISIISYSLPDGTSAMIMREEHNDLTITITKEVDSTVTDSKWLRLVGDSSMAHPAHAALKVAAAFELEEEVVEQTRRGKDRGTRRELIRRVVPVDSGEVCIYFPAVKEESGLRFHIHAPFASTVARDSVRDDPNNTQLIADIGRLIAGHLPALRDDGLITDTLLAALPNEDDPLQAPYTLIRDAVIAAFNTEPVTPVRGRGGSYAPANELVSSPSEFRNLLEEQDLKTLMYIHDGVDREHEPRWIRDSNGRAAKFLDSLSAESFGWAELRSTLQSVQPGRQLTSSGWHVTPLEHDLEAWLNWIAAKSDKELLDLYQLLGRGAATYNLLQVKLSEIPLIRLRARGVNKHVPGASTYLPSGRSDTVSTRVPIDLAYFDDQDDETTRDLRSFYKAAGVQRWNEEAKVEARLASYATPAYRRPSPSTSEDFAAHLADVKAFVSFAKSNPERARDMLGDVEFLLAPDLEAGDGGLQWVSPAASFIDGPFEETGFASLYQWEFEPWDEDDPDSGDWTQPDRHGPADIYMAIPGFVAFLKQLGATHTFVVGKTNHVGNPHFQRQWYPAKTSSYTIDEDWRLQDFTLADITATENPALLLSLWRVLVAQPKSKGVARYRGNASSNLFTFESKLAQALKSIPWVLTRHGDVRLPKDVLAEDLPDGWETPADESLLIQVGFGTRDKIAKEQRERLRADLVAQGGSSEQADAVLEAISSGVPPEILIAAADEWRLRRASFPELASENPSRRAEVASADAINAPIRETEEKVRQIVRGQGQVSEETRAYLKQNYTNESGELICQSCHSVMPFKLKDGTWYFEAVQVVPGRKRMHRANALAMCPLCAARYKYVRDTKDQAVIDDLLAITVEPGQGLVEVAVLIAGRRTTLRFTGKHAIDLQAALSAAGEDRT